MLGGFGVYEPKGAAEIYEKIGRQFANGSQVSLYLDQKKEIDELRSELGRLRLEVMALTQARSKQKRR